MTDSTEEITQLPTDHFVNVLWMWEDRPFSDEFLGLAIGSATNFHAEQVGAGRASQNISALHRVVRATCSDVFAELKADNPHLNKTELNADPQLTALNSLRSALHGTMIRRHKEATKPRKQAWGFN